MSVAGVMGVIATGYYTLTSNGRDIELILSWEGTACLGQVGYMILKIDLNNVKLV